MDIDNPKGERTLEERRAADARNRGCAIVLFIIIPGSVGVGIVYGIGMGFLSVPLWFVLAVMFIAVIDKGNINVETKRRDQGYN